MIYRIQIQTSLGIFALLIQDDFIIRLFFENDNPFKGDKQYCEFINDGVDCLIESSSHPVAEMAQKQINEYAAGHRCNFKLPLKICMVQDLVRSAIEQMQSIPYAQTVSYKELASWIGCKSIRAVSTAVGRNPLPIFIPCHRIISSSGGIGGYRGGLELKKKLLMIEGLIQKI